VHFFRFKSLQTEVLDIDKANQEEESKFADFFKMFKEKLLPSLLTNESSHLKIRLDPATTLNEPYIIFPSNNSTLINIVTYSGFNLKYSIEDILTPDEKQKLQSI